MEMVVTTIFLIYLSYSIVLTYICYRLNLETNLPRNWTQIASIPITTYYAPMVAYKDELLIVFGGKTGGAMLDGIQAYNITSGGWNDSFGVMPEKRVGHCAVLEGDNVCVWAVF